VSCADNYRPQNFPSPSRLFNILLGGDKIHILSKFYNKAQLHKNLKKLNQSMLLKRGRYKSLQILPVDADATSFLEKADHPVGYPRVKAKERTALSEYTVAGDSEANLLVEFRSDEERADFLLMENIIRRIQILPNLNVPHQMPLDPGPPVFPSSES